MTAPSIFQFYITKFLFPWKLASTYYWVYPHFSFQHFLVPLIIDLIVIVLVVCLALAIRKHGTKAHYITFMYFSIWAALGLAMLLQIVPLDFTATGAWFYFPMVGVLGMVGITVVTFRKSVKTDRRFIYSLAAAIILVFGVTTAMYGRNWSSAYSLAKHDIAASPNDFEADYQISIYDYGTGDYFDSEAYAARSVAIFPYATNYNSLGVAYLELGEYPQAQTAFVRGLTYLKYCSIYDNMSVLTQVYGSPYQNQKVLISAVQHCPDDATPWLYLAILDYTHGAQDRARYAITQAYKLGAQDNSSIPGVYSAIMNNQSLSTAL